MARAPINADGTLNGFVDTGVSLIRPRYQHASAVIGDYLYVFGGRNPTETFPYVERARINSDGTLGSFATYSQSLATARRAIASAVFGNSLHLIGGWDNGDQVLGSVERSSLQ